MIGANNAMHLQSKIEMDIIFSTVIHLISYVSKFPNSDSYFEYSGNIFLKLEPQIESTEYFTYVT